MNTKEKANLRREKLLKEKNRGTAKAKRDLAIIELAKKGLTNKEIATKMGITCGVVAMVKFNSKEPGTKYRRDPGEVKRLIQKAIELRLKGHSNSYIAKELNVALSYLVRLLSEHRTGADIKRKNAVLPKNETEWHYSLAQVAEELYCRNLTTSIVTDERIRQYQKLALHKLKIELMGGVKKWRPVIKSLIYDGKTNKEIINYLVNLENGGENVVQDK